MNIFQLQERSSILNPGEIHVYHAFQDASPARIKGLKDVLTGDEIERANRFKFEKDHNSYVVARSLLRYLLSSYLDKEPGEIDIKYNQYGKPEIASDAKLRFNVSHSGGIALYGFAYEREIGVDVEENRPYRNSINIVERFFSKAESGEFSRIDDSLKEKVFWQCWTRKEAYIKAVGLGLSLPLDTFSILPLSGGSPSIIDGNNLSERWSVRDIDIHDGYSASIAVEQMDFDVKICKVDID